MSKTLIFSVFKTILNRRDAKIFLSFGLLPILVPFLSGNMEGLDVDYTKSFLAFLETTLLTQYQITLPILILSVLISSVFRDEIDTGILFLYKDISREMIFHAKFVGLLLVYAVYVLLTMSSSLFTYFTLLVPGSGVVNRLVPIDGNHVQVALLSIIATILLNVTTIALVSMVSVKQKTLVAVLSGVFFTLFATTGPLLIGIRYLIPITYAQNRTSGNFGSSFIMIVILSTIYYMVCYIEGKNSFKKVEF